MDIGKRLIHIMYFLAAMSRILLVYSGNLCHQFCFGHQFPIRIRMRLHMANSSSNWRYQITFKNQRISGKHFLFKLHIVDLHEISQVVLRIGNRTQDKDSAGLRHGFNNEYTWHYWRTWKMTNKETFVHRDIFKSHDMTVAHFNDPVDQQKRRSMRQDTHDFVDV